MAFTIKKWVGLGKPNPTPLSESAMDDLETRIANAVNNLDSSEIAVGEHTLKQVMTIYDDTQATDMKDLLRKKIEVAKPYFDGSTLTVFVSGGWQGHNYGFSIVNRNSRTSDVYTAIYFQQNAIYICRIYQGNYTYYKFNAEEVT